MTQLGFTKIHDVVKGLFHLNHIIIDRDTPIFYHPQSGNYVNKYNWYVNRLNCADLAILGIFNARHT